MTGDHHLGKIYGNVKLTARLGQGAMGAVYRGWHQHFEREVAVKVLLATEGRGNSRERFLREGQSAAKIEHDNVVRVFDAGECDGVVYLVMELVEGFSLGKIVDDQGPLPPEAVARLGAGISKGLAAIHAKGIIHRDIKPDNILLGHDRRPKITDLGLAKQTDDPELNRLTATGMVVGTPLYVSPENIRDPKSATVSSDIYSLGATLYHLLTGRPPFQERTPYEVMRAHLESRVQPIRELSPVVPQGLAQLVERCLSKSPDKRPNAQELALLLSQGARLRGNAIGGVALMIAVTVVAVIALACGAWAFLNAERHRAAGQPAPSRLTVHADRPDTRSRIDGGAWGPTTADATVLGAGRHHIEVQSTTPGPQWSWEGDVDLLANQLLDVPVTLATANVTMQRIPVAGEGMLFCDGVAFGLDLTYPVTQAGSYALARWNGTLFQAQIAHIDTRGQLTSDVGAALDHPNGPAYWRHVDDSGATIDAHHVVCWWEAELARDRAHLPSPNGWLVQGQKREQPALALTPAMVAAARELTVSRLPDRDLARRLSAAYQSSVWCDTQGHLDFFGGGGPRNALLILLPSDPGPHR